MQCGEETIDNENLKAVTMVEKVSHLLHRLSFLAILLE